MSKLLKNICLISFFLFFCSTFIFAEEITITTYYPSPYGSYNYLQTDKLGVGDNSGDGSFTSSDVPTTSGHVWIKSALGIGTTNLVYPLNISGNTTDRVRLYIENVNATSKSSLVQLHGVSDWLMATDTAVNGSNDFGIYGNSAWRLYINSAGSVGIGTTTPGIHALSVVGTAGLSSGTAWTNTSDRRWKNIESTLRGDSLSKILSLRPISYTWNKLHDQQFGKNPGLKYGFIAQDLESVLPSMVSKDDKGYYWYNPSGMEAVLTAAIQEQQDIINVQQLQIKGLKIRLDRLEKRLTQSGK